MNPSIMTCSHVMVYFTTVTHSCLYLKCLLLLRHIRYIAKSRFSISDLHTLATFTAFIWLNFNMSDVNTYNLTDPFAGFERPSVIK